MAPPLTVAGSPRRLPTAELALDREDTVATGRDQRERSHTRSTMLRGAAAAFLFSPFLYRRQDVGDNFASGLCAEVSLAMDPNADSVRLQVTPADHEHGMDLVVLGALDLSVDLICREIKLSANFVRAEFGVDAFGEIHERLLGADRENAHLLGCEPKWEITGIVLDEKADESLMSTRAVRGECKGEFSPGYRDPCRPSQIASAPQNPPGWWQW